MNKPFMNRNLILIGMPGCGKSTCGVLAAKALCKSFIDTDLLIQKREGCRLEEIIAVRGEAAFLDLEGEIVAGLSAEHAVIATGGSVIFRDGAMQHLKQLGTVIYLKISLRELLKRLQDAKSRGVVLKEGQTFEGLYLERIWYYEHYADLTIDEGTMDFEGVVKTVYTVIREQLGLPADPEKQ